MERKKEGEARGKPLTMGAGGVYSPFFETDPKPDRTGRA
jgi:hypothetical protein